MVKLRSLDFNLQIMEHYLNLGSNLRQVNCRVDFTHHSLHLKATGSLRCQYPAFQGLELICMLLIPQTVAEHVFPSSLSLSFPSIFFSASAHGLVPSLDLSDIKCIK